LPVAVSSGASAAPIAFPSASTRLGAEEEPDVKRHLLSALAFTAFALLAGSVRADVLQIPMGPVSAEPKPVRLAAGDRVGRMIFARYYRPSLEDAVPERMSLFQEKKILPLEDWLREWGAVQIHQIGRPY
jgi:hypothetical protein